MPEGAEEPALLKRGDGRPREAKVDASRFDKLKTVLRVTSGNFLEMYDFFLFGIYARQIGHTFFPNDDPYASLMLTFLSFAAGFAMRPIGALVLGPYIDRIGRRKASSSRCRSWPAARSSSPSCRPTRPSACSRRCSSCSDACCRVSPPGSSSAASRSTCRKWRRPDTM